MFINKYRRKAERLAEILADRQTDVQTRRLTDATKIPIGVQSVKHSDRQAISATDSQPTEYK